MAALLQQVQKFAELADQSAPAFHTREMTAEANWNRQPNHYKERVRKLCF